MRSRWLLALRVSILLSGVDAFVILRFGLPDWLTASSVVSASAFFTAIVTAAVTIYSAWLGRQALRQEERLRAEERAQHHLNTSFLMINDLPKDYFQDPHIIYYRRLAAASLMKGEYSRELQNLMDFFSRVARMVMAGAVYKDAAFRTFYGRFPRYWTAAVPLVEEERLRMNNPQLWRQTEKLYWDFLDMIKANPKMIEIAISRSVGSILLLPSSRKYEGNRSATHPRRVLLRIGRLITGLGASVNQDHYCM